MNHRSWTDNLNLPNGLTALRVLLTPALVWFLLRRSYGAALGVFAVAGITDALDGFVAKRFGLVTRVGAFLDPLADKILLISSVVVLAGLGAIPRWLAATIVLRDAVILAGALAYRAVAGHLEMAPCLLSKVNTFAQLSLVLVVLLRGAGAVQVTGWLPTLYAVVVGTTLASGVHYVAVWGIRACRAEER